MKNLSELAKTVISILIIFLGIVAIRRIMYIHMPFQERNLGTEYVCNLPNSIEYGVYVGKTNNDVYIFKNIESHKEGLYFWMNNPVTYCDKLKHIEYIYTLSEDEPSQELLDKYFNSYKQ